MLGSKQAGFILICNLTISTVGRLVRPYFVLGHLTRIGLYSLRPNFIFYDFNIYIIYQFRVEDHFHVGISFKQVASLYIPAARTLFYTSLIFDTPTD